MTDARAWRRRLRARFPDVYDDGFRCGLTGKAEGAREPGGYPKGFHDWPLDIRNAFYAGFNVGYLKRKAIKP